MNIFLKFTIGVVSAWGASLLARKYWEHESIKICNKNANIFTEKFPIPDKECGTLTQRKTAIINRDAAINAFTHAYTSAKLTNFLGETLTRWLGNVNEIFEDFAVHNKKDSIKDQYNNLVGREIAKSGGNISKSCLEACKYDVLINSIFDQRVKQILNNKMDYNVLRTSIASILKP